MKKVIVSMMMCTFLMHSVHASSAVSAVASTVNSAATILASSAKSSVLHVMKLAQNNPHIVFHFYTFQASHEPQTITQQS